MDFLKAFLSESYKTDFLRRRSVGSRERRTDLQAPAQRPRVLYVHHAVPGHGLVGNAHPRRSGRGGTPILRAAPTAATGWPGGAEAG